MLTSFSARHYQSSEPLQLEFDDAQLRHVTEGEADTATRLLVAPLFIDLQINGYQGVNFCDAEQLKVEDVGTVVNTLGSHGVAYFLPTVTTSSFENIKTCFETLVASREDPIVARAIPGFHLEGPYISPVEGPRGAHPKAYAREPSWDEFERLQDAAAGLIKLVTIAPELPGAIAFIEKLREGGIIPAIGHTNAETKDVEAASLAGAVLSTHLGNGAHAHIRRHPNYLWDQLANDNLWASLIVDGFHLPANVVKVMIRAKGLERIILVTDAVTVAGLAPGRYSFMGKHVELKPEGVVKLSGTDYLAGAALTMPEAIVNISRFADLEQQTAIDMASQHPYDLLSGIAGISRDIFDKQNFTLLRWDDNRLEVIATVVEGQARFSNFTKHTAGGLS